MIFLLVFVLFFAYFLKPSLVGFDSYFFYNMTCGIEPLHDAPLGSLFVLSLIPCGLFWAKSVLFGLTLFVVFVLKKAGDLVSARWGFLAPIFYLSSPALIGLLKFEDDQFGFPFIVAGTYFLISFYINKRVVELFKAIGAFMVAGLFWKGAVYFVLLAFLSHPYFLAAAGLLLFIFWQPLTANVLPNFYVWENYPLVGFFSQSFFIAGYFVFPFLSIPIVYFTVLTLLKAKFFPFLTLFLVLGCVRLMERAKPHQRLAFFIFVFFLFLSNFVGLYGLPVNDSQIAASDFAMETSRDLNVGLSNNLIYGYFIQSRGLPVAYDGGFYSLDHYKNANGIVLEVFDVTKDRPSCELLKRFEDNFVFVCGLNQNQ